MYSFIFLPFVLLGGCLYSAIDAAPQGPSYTVLSYERGSTIKLPCLLPKLDENVIWARVEHGHVYPIEIYFGYMHGDPIKESFWNFRVVPENDTTEFKTVLIIKGFDEDKEGLYRCYSKLNPSRDGAYEIVVELSSDEVKEDHSGLIYPPYHAWAARENGDIWWPCGVQRANMTDGPEVIDVFWSWKENGEFARISSDMDRIQTPLYVSDTELKRVLMIDYLYTKDPSDYRCTVQYEDKIIENDIRLQLRRKDSLFHRVRYSAGCTPPFSDPEYAGIESITIL